MSKQAKLLIVGFAFVGVVLAMNLELATPTDIRLCTPRPASSALPAIALERGFFASQGLRVHLSTEDLGMRCIERLNAGEVDLAVAYVPPVIASIRRGQKLQILTEVHSSNRNAAIVYRPPRIRGPRDLMGKRVALIKGTNSEALFRMYLLAHDIPDAKVNTLFKKPSEVASALQNGEVDAGVLWEPELSQTLKSGNFAALESSFYTEFSMLVKRPQGTPALEAAIEPFIRSLAKAQNLIDRDPERARLITAQVLHLDLAYLTPEVWARFRFRMGLSAVLESMLEQVQTLFDRGEGLPVIEPANFFEPRFLNIIHPEVVTYK